MLDSLLVAMGLAKDWPKLSWDEIQQHDSKESLWIVAGNDVYDVTNFLQSHPGGTSALLRRGGGARDCTEDYHFHSRSGRKQWAQYKIGILLEPWSKKKKNSALYEGHSMVTPHGDTAITAKGDFGVIGTAAPVISDDDRQNEGD